MCLWMLRSPEQIKTFTKSGFDLEWKKMTKDVNVEL